MPKKYVKNDLFLNMMVRKNNSMRCITTLNRNNNLFQLSSPLKHFQGVTNRRLCTTYDEETKQEINSASFTKEDIEKIEKVAATIPQSMYRYWCCFEISRNC